MSAKMAALRRRMSRRRGARGKTRMVAGTVVMSDADFEAFMSIVDSPEKPGFHPKLARIKAAHDAMIARKGGY